MFTLPHKLNYTDGYVISAEVWSSSEQSFRCLCLSCISIFQNKFC